MPRRVGFLLFLIAGAVAAQQGGPPNAILLVARPELADPNFREAVVLVTQAPDGSTVGVILNRPTERRDEKSGSPFYSGGPVMTEVTVALFRTESVPGGPSFAVLKNVYLSMHPAVIDPLLAGPKGNYRIYSGFSGWAPGQLERELERDDWLVVPATEDVLFRAGTTGLWREMLERASVRQKPHVRRETHRYTFAHGATDPRSARLQHPFM